jgi:hypothetical protein
VYPPQAVAKWRHDRAARLALDAVKTRGEGTKFLAMNENQIQTDVHSTEFAEVEWRIVHDRNQQAINGEDGRQEFQSLAHPLAEIFAGSPVSGFSRQKNACPLLHCCACQVQIADDPLISAELLNHSGTARLFFDTL